MEMQLLNKVIAGFLLLGLAGLSHAATPRRLGEDNPADTFFVSRRLIPEWNAEVRPGCILPTNIFLRGENARNLPLRSSFSAHLTYGFRFRPSTDRDRIYGRPVQGIGAAWYTFGNREEIGRPAAFYLFQGARLARLAPRLSLHYEWNFGLSFGWHPHDFYTNPYNRVIGSRINAYLHAGLYLNWALSPRLELRPGIGLTHFSNGNTKYPNAGLNTAGLKIGVAYRFGRESLPASSPSVVSPLPVFPRHISYDAVVFGSWRRKGVFLGESQIASPKAYAVAGFNFSALYNFGYKFRAGLSLDGVYDGSANVYAEDYIVGTEPSFYTPPTRRQLALGLSGRAEFVMPYFTIGLGAGRNFLHDGGDLRGWYQVLALKIELLRNSFLHIGYTLKDFHNPNFLMVGIGFRFHNLYPALHR